MNRQVPHGPDHLDCPKWLEPMSKVCHKCPWWTMLRGVNSNTGESVDRWDCAIPNLVIGGIDGANQSRQVGAAVESFRNESLAAAAEASARATAATEAMTAAINRLTNVVIYQHQAMLTAAPTPLVAQTYLPDTPSQLNGLG